MSRVVSHHVDVKAAIENKTAEVGAKAEIRLGMHHDSGDASIDVDMGDVDGFVSLVDDAAMSIEFGHMVKGKYERAKPKYVPGLYIISGAAGLTG